ncbi:MAG: restriction endonuclease subunit S [Acidimicrobiales bacterium]
MTELPNGWGVATIEELAADGGVTDGPFGSNLKTEHYTEAGPRVVRLQNIGDGTFRDEKAHISEEHFDRLVKHAVEPNDVLVASLGELLPRACMAPESLGPAIVKADCIRVRAGAGVLPALLMWSLNAPQTRQRVGESIKGVGRPRVNLGGLRALELPVPPLPEQQRIVTAIEEAFSKVDAGEAGLRTVRQLLKRMREAVLAAAVTGRLVPQDPADTPATKLLADLGLEPIEPDDVPALPDGWAWASLGDVADVVGGVTKDAKRQDDPSFVERPYLRVANVQRGYLDLEVVTSLRVPPEKAAKLELRPGDVLLNEGGDRDKLGRGWVWEGQVEGCIHQNHVFRARLAGGIEPKLVSIWGNTFGQGWFEGRGKQSTNLASINLSTLKSFPIPIAPAEEQPRILAEVERQLTFLDVCERTVDSELARSAALRRSVLKSAFEGRLAPQDPSDEPAWVLLDRIREERAAAPKPTRRARRTA